MGVSVTEGPGTQSWLTVLTALLSGLFGILLGAWLTSRREGQQRRHDFVMKQLNQFYSPLLGLRKEVIMRSDLREKIRDAADGKWRTLCVEARQSGGPEALERLMTERRPEFQRLIEFENRQGAEDLMPTHRRIVSLFRDNLWLADNDTQEYLPRLIEYVDLWERWLQKAIPLEVLQSVDKGGGSLRTLDEHLQKKHDQLQEKLRRGVV